MFFPYGPLQIDKLNNGIITLTMRSPENMVSEIPFWGVQLKNTETDTLNMAMSSPEHGICRVPGLRPIASEHSLPSTQRGCGGWGRLLSVGSNVTLQRAILGPRRIRVWDFRFSVVWPLIVPTPDISAGQLHLHLTVSEKNKIKKWVLQPTSYG